MSLYRVFLRQWRVPSSALSRYIASDTYDAFRAFVGLASVYFLFFDEEPLFDFSDWNLTHVFLLLLCSLLAYSETSLRARYGQTSETDDFVTLAAITSWVRLVNYTRLILIFFGFHYLVPLEAELVEMVEVHLLCSSWFSASLLMHLCVLSLVTVVGLTVAQLGLTLNFASAVICLSVMVVSLLCIALLLMWDLALTLASHPTHQGPQIFYSRSMTALTPSARPASADAADWHKPRLRTASLRFEGLTQAYLAAFLVIAFLEAALSWSLLLLGLVREGVASLTTDRVALGLLWLKNLWVVIIACWATTSIFTLRTLLRTEM